MILYIYIYMCVCVCVCVCKSFVWFLYVYIDLFVHIYECHWTYNPTYIHTYIHTWTCKDDFSITCKLLIFQFEHTHKKRHSHTHTKTYTYTFICVLHSVCIYCICLGKRDLIYTRYSLKLTTLSFMCVCFYVVRMYVCMYELTDI